MGIRKEELHQLIDRIDEQDIAVAYEILNRFLKSSTLVTDKTAASLSKQDKRKIEHKFID